MSNYIEIDFENISSEKSEILIAELSNIGFEGFEEDSNALKAFIPEDLFDPSALKEIAAQCNVEFFRRTIAETNWNQVWESNFQPVLVDDFVMVRADFHPPAKGVAHEIVITPKMSFGTGHHATTFMMMQQMQSFDFKEKDVFDFGTGTGVLAILAEKLGAKKVIAIDNDEWSISNALENVARNNCTRVDVRNNGTALLNLSFDIILANINKNVILDNFPALVSQLKEGGVILLSGLLKEDEDDIVQAAKSHLLVFAGSYLKDNWLCLKFTC